MAYQIVGSPKRLFASTTLYRPQSDSQMRFRAVRVVTRLGRFGNLSAASMTLPLYHSSLRLQRGHPGGLCPRDTV